MTSNINNNSNNEYKYTLSHFLDERTTQTGQTPTHTSICEPRGSYVIDNSDIDTFYNLYEESLLRNAIKRFPP